MLHAVPAHPDDALARFHVRLIIVVAVQIGVQAVGVPSEKEQSLLELAAAFFSPRLLSLTHTTSRIFAGSVTARPFFE